MSAATAPDLNEHCLHALERFMSEAQETCRMLAAMRSHPLTLDERLRLVRQRFSENAALDGYLQIRQRLFDLAAPIEFSFPSTSTPEVGPLLNSRVPAGAP